MASLPAASRDDTVEVRLARWRAAGLVNDQRLHKRAVITTILLICGFVIAFGVVLHGQ